MAEQKRPFRDEYVPRGGTGSAQPGGEPQGGTEAAQPSTEPQGKVLIPEPQTKTTQSSALDDKVAKPERRVIKARTIHDEDREK